LTFGVLLTIMGILLASVLARFFREPQLAPIIRWMSLSFLLSCLGAVQGSMLRRELRFKSLALRSLTGEVSGGLVGVLTALAGAGVWSLVAMRLTSTAINCLILWKISS